MRFARDVDALGPVLDLSRTAGGFTAATHPTDHGGIMGAHQLLQQVVAAERTDPGRRVISLHTAFLAGGHSGEPVDIDVERLQRGRSFSGYTLTFRQGELAVSRAQVLLTSEEPDFLRHQSPAAVPVDTDVWPVEDYGPWPGPVRRAPATGTGEVVRRFGLGGAVHDESVGRGLVALATEPVVLGTLLDLAATRQGGWEFRQGSGNVVTQTVTLLEPLADAEALIVSAVPVWAGGGRAHGSGTVTDRAGRLLATYSTTGVLRGPAR